MYKFYVHWEFLSFWFGNNNSNILSSSIDVDITGRFQFVEVYSQSNNDTHGENSVNPGAGKEIDSDITTPRRKIIYQNTASQTLSLKDLAKWNVAIRRAKGSRYQCKVQDFFTTRNNGLLWNVNTLVSLKDDVCQVQPGWQPPGRPSWHSGQQCPWTVPLSPKLARAVLEIFSAIWAFLLSSVFVHYCG